MIARAIAGFDRLSLNGEDGSEAPKGLRQAQPERQTRAVTVAVAVAVAVQRPYEVNARR
jgi:hypothetical protein